MVYVDKNWLSSFHPCVICHHDDAVEIDYDVYKTIDKIVVSMTAMILLVNWLKIIYSGQWNK